MALETRDFTGVELLAAGTWQGHGCPANGCEFNLEKLASIVEATQEALAENFRAPVKLGHFDQKLLASDGLPAAGWLDNVVLSGNTIVADIKNVPTRVASIMDAGGWRNRSVELGMRNGKLILTGLALLGSSLPAVDTLADIEKLYTAFELERPDESATVIVFTHSEDIVDTDRWLTKLSEAHPHAQPQIDALRRKIEGSDNMDISAIASKLGLGDDADENAVVAAIDALNAKSAGTATDDSPPVHSDNAIDKAEFSALQAKVLRLETEKAAEGARASVEQAISNGKLLPAQREQSLKMALRDLEGFNAFVESMPSLITFGERGTSSTSDDTGTISLSAMERDVADQLGITHDQALENKYVDSGKKIPDDLRQRLDAAKA